MYAIIETGGKQFKVEKDQIIKVEKLDVKADDVVDLKVLMISDEGKVKIGNPEVQGAVCKAKVLGDGKGDKIIVYKYKAKKNERKRQGHRQPFTALQITQIQ